jgi:hypothetical protein
MLIVNSFINKFFIEEIKTLLDKSDINKYLMLMIKVKFTDENLGYRTLGHLRRVNYQDKSLFQSYITDRLGLLNDSYTVNSISELIFSYIIKEGEATDNRALLSDTKDKSIVTHRFNNLNLPISLNPSDYGRVIDTIERSDFIRHYVVSPDKRVFHIDVSKDGITNNVAIVASSDLNWIDIKINESLFKRIIGKSTIYFMDGEKVLQTRRNTAKAFTKLQIVSKILNYFVTMDIETVLIQSKITPYLIGAYNGTDKISIYANKTRTGEINVSELFRNFLNALLTFLEDRNTFYVYAHNLSNFDGRLLLKQLFDFGKVIPIIHNGKLITIKVKLTIEGYVGKTIIFKHSMLLLPSSLRNLGIAFDVPVTKGNFPFKLLNIFYTGVFPQFNYWTDITNQEWLGLKTAHGKKMWSFKDESIKYNLIDCITLHQVLTKFVDLIFNNFKVDAHSTLTAPSLAFKIYKTNSMPNNTIYQLLGNAEKDIRLSYTGGAVDVYIPHNKLGLFKNSNEYKKLYYYDVNALYPFIMANTPMPVGKAKFFKGDIRRVNPDAFGVFYCKITSPEFLLHPILQRKINTSNGIRTVAGLGSWEGCYNSLELDNALKYGYQFEILYGYLYDKAYIFKDYVTVMTALRSN